MARPRVLPEPKVGDKFSKLTVKDIIIDYDSANRIRRTYTVSCECGNVRTVTEYNLIKGVVVQCRACIPQRNDLLKRGIARVYDSYKDASRKRGIEFDLTKDQVGEIIIKPCFYCTHPGSNSRIVQGTHKDMYFTYNGIDRMDSSIGYYPENVVPCCSDCNYGKRNMTTEQFLSWVRRICEVHK